MHLGELSSSHFRVSIYAMGNKWWLILVLAGYLLLLAVFIITGIRDVRENRKHMRRLRRNKTFDFDKFCGEIPKDENLKDPYVLIDGRWVRKSSGPHE